MTEPLRFGIVGTGHWASRVHLPALLGDEHVRLIGIFGQNRARAQALAAPNEIEAFDDFGIFLSHVDAVSFAVPPQVQASLATDAAEAGKCLLLEKPLATSLRDARCLVDTIARARVPTRIFLPGLYSAPTLDLIERANGIRPDRAIARFRSSSLLSGSPFAASAWRKGKRGALWDVGPHMLSVLITVMGPVEEIAAAREGSAAFSCEMLHASGARTRMELDLMDPRCERANETYEFCGADGMVSGGAFSHDWWACFQAAVGGLTGSEPPKGLVVPDARFGLDLVSIIATACASLDGCGISRRVPILEAT
ncbi:Gfo/Idh/MocA family protein [Sphingomonas oryzagri]